MTEVATQKPAVLRLPACIVTKVDFLHVLYEIEKVDSDLSSADIRQKAGMSEQFVLNMTPMLRELLTLNKLTLDNSHMRTELVKYLRQLKDTLPTIHMTFAVTADRESLEELSGWVRTNIHPQAVISVGLQPALVAGVYLRTTNRVQDLSVRGLLEEHRGVLIQDLEALRG